MKVYFEFKEYLGISIHALVKRATCAVLDIDLIAKDFNPRPREEGDDRRKRVLC